jgi:hypothetical protein
VIGPRELGKGYSNIAIAPYKPPVEVTEAEEGLDTFYGIGVMPVFNYLDLVRIDLDSIGANNKSEVFCILDSKLILLDVCLEACLVQSFNHLLDMLELILRVDQDIIEISSAGDI